MILKDTNLDLYIAQVVLPSSVRRDVFALLHAVPTACHFVVLRTLHRVRQRFYWPNNKRNYTMVSKMSGGLSSTQPCYETTIGSDETISC